MSYFYDTNLGFPGEIYDTYEEEQQEVWYPVVSQIYVPESQLYNVVHAVEFHGTTYFFQNLVEYQVYRLYDVISYAPANVVEENASYGYWPAETSENVEQNIVNTPEYDYQPSAVEILSSESHEAMPTSMCMDNYASNGHDLNATSCYNSWDATYVHVHHAINDPSSGFRDYNVTHYSEVYENRSFDEIGVRNEINRHLEDMNYGWPRVYNGWSLNDAYFQEPIQGPVCSQEIVDKKAEIKYKKDRLYLIALSGKLYQKSSIPVVKKMPVVEEMDDENSVIESNNGNIGNITQGPVIEEMNDENSVIESNNGNIGNITQELVTGEMNDENSVTECNNGKIGNINQGETVLPSNIFSEQRKKVCRRKSVQVIEIKEVIEKNNDIDGNIESNNKNVLKVTEMDSLFQESIFTKGSQKLYKKESIQMFKRMCITEHVADEKFAIDSCSENIIQRKVVNKLFVKTEVCSEKSKKLYKTENNQVLQRTPIIEEITDDDCAIDTCKENRTRKGCQLVKTNACTLKSKKFCKREKHQRFKRMSVTPQGDDEEYEKSYRIDESEDLEKKFDAFLDSNRQIGNYTPPQDTVFLNENINTKETTCANDDNLPEVIISEKTNKLNDSEMSSYNLKDIKKKDNISNREEIRPSIESDEKNAYEGMTLIPLNDHLEENESTKTDDSFERGNETQKVCSQVKKPKKKRFHRIRKFFGRILSCCSKGQT